MKRYIFVLMCWILGITFGYAQNIYVTNSPSVADVEVYVVPVPDMADLIVYKAPTPSYWGVNENIGIWYFVPVPDMADKTIYYVKTPDLADLNVYFTEIPSLAGWQNPQKKNVLQTTKNGYI